MADDDKDPIEYRGEDELASEPAPGKGPDAEIAYRGDGELAEGEEDDEAPDVTPTYRGDTKLAGED